MSDNEEQSIDTMGGLTLYSADVEIPECVSSGTPSTVGSSVSQSKEPTVKVNAAMFNNAMSVIMNLQAKVFLFNCLNQ